MAFVLVFVAGNPDRPLTAFHLAEAEHLLDDDRIAFELKPRWLHIHKAAELDISGKPTPAQLADLKAVLAIDEIDLFVVPQENRRKKLLIADMDATIVTTETLDELAEHAGLKEKISAITARAMRGELDFAAALDERVGLLKGLPLKALEETLAQTVLTPGAKTLLRMMRHHGATCVLVSGGFTYFTDAIARQVGFNFNHGNTLGIEGDALSGKVLPPLLDKNAKLSYLNEYKEKLGLNEEDIMAIGDGANDLPMLLAAGLGLGVYPKPLVAQSLDNGIVYSDLTSALYIQGYTGVDIDAAPHLKVS
jgi:phosphoserine phosphatase